MSTLALDFPLGRPLIPSAQIRRRRPVPPGSIPQVVAGDMVRPEQVIAEGGPANVWPAVVRSGLAGRVLEVVPGQAVTIEGAATLLHGVLGVGSQVAGMLALLPRGESLAVVPIPRDAVIVYPQQVPLMLLQRAMMGGAAAIITGSIAVRDLEAFARADLTALLDGLLPGAAAAPLTVVLSEGLGAQPMNVGIFQTLAQRVGETVLVSGATNPRRNLRPEVALPLPFGTVGATLPLDAGLVVGARVCVSAGALRGACGMVAHLFTRYQLSPAGQPLPSAALQLDDGTSAIVPLCALDRTG